MKRFFKLIKNCFKKFYGYVFLIVLLLLFSYIIIRNYIDEPNYIISSFILSIVTSIIATIITNAFSLFSVNRKARSLIGKDTRCFIEIIDIFLNNPINKKETYNKLLDIYLNICIYSSDLINNSVYNKISKTINSVLYEFNKEITNPAIILRLKKELEINLNEF